MHFNEALCVILLLNLPFLSGCKPRPLQQETPIGLEFVCNIQFNSFILFYFILFSYFSFKSLQYSFAAVSRAEKTEFDFFLSVQVFLFRVENIQELAALLREMIKRANLWHFSVLNNVQNVFLFS